MNDLTAIPRICDNVDVGIDETTQELHFIFVNSRTDVVVSADTETIALVGLMDGGHTVSQLLNSVRDTVSQESVMELIAFLEDERILEWSGSSDHSVFPQFLRQIAFFKDFTGEPEEVQRRLDDAHVGIVGAGAIGASIASQLVRMGLRTIHVIDPDCVEPSNLSRTPLYLLSDIGVPKATALQNALRRVSESYSPGRSYTEPLTGTSHSGLTWMSEHCSVVVNCADQPNVAQTSEWVGRVCMKTAVPHVLAGGYRTHLGFIGPTVIPGQSACWKCFADDYLRNDPFGKHGWRRLPSCRVTGGSLMALSEMVASVHSWEIVRILTKMLPPLMVDRKAEIDFQTLGISWFEVHRAASCTECALASA